MYRSACERCEVHGHALSHEQPEGGFVDGANYVRDACTPREPAEVAQVVGDSRVAEREHQKLGGWSCGAYRRLERAVE
jgi:hypothetical protein